MIYRFGIFFTKKDKRSNNVIGINFLYVLKISEDEYLNDLYIRALMPDDGIHVACLNE